MDTSQVTLAESPATTAARVAELAAYDVIGHAVEPELAALAELAALVCGARTAAINLIDATHQHQVATYGIGPSICTREESMCEVTIHQQAPILLADARTDPRFRQNPFVTGVIANVRFYVSSQLRTPAGVTIGTLCVFDEEPRAMTPSQTGAVDALAKQVVDILELRRRTAQLQDSLDELTRAREELRRSNEQLGAFADQVSHDLRNPLTAVMGYVDELAGLPSVAGDAEAAWLAGRAGQAAARMLSQMSELLDYGHIGGRLASTEVDLARLAYLVRDDVSELVRSSGGNLAINTLPVVSGDEHQLRSVLQNLVTNALKFVPAGVAPDVAISARRVAGGWRVEVADRGVGVPTDRAEDVFAMFSRTGQVDADGHGIGLATSRRVVEAHGGEIGLEPRAGGGTTAWFELPDPGPAPA